jgi:hypothetical protein
VEAEYNVHGMLGRGMIDYVILYLHFSIVVVEVSNGGGSWQPNITAEVGARDTPGRQTALPGDWTSATLIHNTCVLLCSTYATATWCIITYVTGVVCLPVQDNRGAPGAVGCRNPVCT